MSFSGIILGLITFLVIGVFHPIVIKSYYWFGLRCWPWFLAGGIVSLVCSLFTESFFIQTILGVLGFTCFWSIHEIFEQKVRVEKGWFPANPRRPEQLGNTEKAPEIELSE